MKTTRRHGYLALAIAALTLPDAASAKETLTLEEVTVTAQKSTELLQDVPVTVNAISGDTFEKNLAFDFRDLGRMVAGLQMQSQGVNQNITLRGVGTNIQAAASPRTTTYYDGSYSFSQQFVFAAQFDIASFEVLRGPQGTLYGKASPTGSIVINTRNPDLTQTEGFIQTSLGQHDLFNTQFGVSVPLIENTLGIRVAGMYDENNSSDGAYASIDRHQLGRSKAGRITALWKPTDRLDARLSYTHVDNDGNQSSAYAQGLGYDRYDRIELSDQERLAGVRISQTVLAVNLDLDDVVLTSQSFYASGDTYELKDMDRTATLGAFQDTQSRFSYMYNQEFRLASSGNDSWDWIQGIYYGKSLAQTHVRNFQRRLNTPTIDTDTFVTLDTNTESIGLFTHNTFFLTDDLTLTAGARWSHERQGSENGADTYVPQLGPDPVRSTVLNSPGTFIAWTGTVKLAYTLDVDSLVFFTIDRGGRGGGQTLDLADTTPDEIQAYSPEYSNSFELGYKSDMLDGRLRFNAAAYYQLYKNFHNLQRFIPIGTVAPGDPDTLIPSTTFDVIQNAREVLVKGAEVDVTYLFNEYVTGSVSVNYNDARFEDYGDAACNSGVPTPTAEGLAYYACDRSGERIGGDAGNWAAVATANFRYPINTLHAEWYMDALYNFNSMRVAPFSGLKSGSFAVVDVFTGLRSANQTWDVKLWAKNVFDREAQIIDDLSMTTLAGQPSGVIPMERVINPRQVGITGTLRF